MGRKDGSAASPGGQVAPDGRGGGTGESWLLRPEEAAMLLGISRSKLYKLMGSEIESVAIGRSRRIPRASLARWLDRLQG